MAADPPSPEDCRSMDDVRAGVDALDRDLIRLLAMRFGYMRAAARIKQARAEVRDEERKARVIANAIAEARATGVPTDVVERLWDSLVEGSIAYELQQWDNAQRN